MAAVTLIFVVALSVGALGADIFDPAVYSFYFYVNTHPDLVQAGLATFDKARDHWANYGLREGRQACGSFHTQQYLQRYPDLAKQFGKNYSAAVNHYLTVGRAAGLLGYVDGGFAGRWTVANPAAGLFLSASSRTAGAVDSLVWNEKEFINAWDHGRELQYAVTTGDGECFNPTEVCL